MSKAKYVYVNGLWQHPDAVNWITSNLENAVDMPVEVLDFHDELVNGMDNATYMKRIIEKYGDLHGGNEDVILHGHSHGGAFSILFSERFKLKKLVLTNQCLMPFGILRKVPNTLKAILGQHGIGAGYEPHYTLKYEDEFQVRLDYFTKNFVLGRDLSRLMAVGKEARKLTGAIRVPLLCIQSMKDEMASVKPNLEFYKNVPLAEYHPSMTFPGMITKQIIKVPNGEHAILEEEGVYQDLYDEIGNFVRRK